MLCDICRKHIATVHLTEVIDDKVMEMHICQVCAQSKAEELGEQLNISDFLGGLAGAGEVKREDYSLKCSSCGLSYREFKKKGLLGCGRCYTTFRLQLLSLFKKIHGSVRHVGKVPPQLDKEVSIDAEVKGLGSRLEKAIHLEEYEEAARLRDEIKKLKESQ